MAVALVYAAFGALWILLSDTALGWLLEDRDTLLLLSTAKGWLFVLLSSVLLFFLVAKPPLRATVADPSAPAERLPWVALAVLTSAILVVTGATLLQSWTQERNQIEVQLRSIASGKATRLSEWHHERLGDAQELRSQPWVTHLWNAWQQDPTADTHQQLGERMDRLALAPGVARVEVYDTLQRMVWPRISSTPSNDPVLTQGLQRVLNRRQAQSLGPWRDPEGQLRLAYVGLLEPAGAPAALVVMHVDPPSHIHAALRDWPQFTTTGEAFLFRREGDEVLILSDPRQDPGAAAVRRMPLSTSTLLSARFLRGEAAPGALLEGSDYRNVPAFGVVLPVEGSDWFLLVKQDRSELLANAVHNAATLTLAGLLGLFSAFAGAYLLLQRRQLARRAQNIQALEESQHRLQDSESRYRLLAENARDVVWLLDLSAHRLVYVSPSVQPLSGFSPEELCRMTLDDILEPDDATRALSWLQERVQRFNQGEVEAGTGVLELAHRHKHGAPVVMEVSIQLIADAHGQAVQAQGVSRDLTERKRAEHQIRMLSQATSQSPVAVLITSPDAVIEYVNPAFERMSGYRADEVVGRNPRMLQSRRTPGETYRRMWSALKQGETWQGELINRHKDGRHYLQSATIAPLRDERGRVVQYISVQMDITAQRAAEERAELLVWFDPLTGLPNRQRLLSDLSELLKHKGQGQLHGLLLINIDRFKAVNEARGHALGDKVLQALAQRLRDTLQGGDMLAHLNGDEFGLLVQNLPGETPAVSTELLRRAELIHTAMQQPLMLGDEGVVMSVSIGVALLNPDLDASAGDILRHADTALHRAKDAGGQQSAFFDAGMGRLVSERFAIEQDLRRGLEAGELRLYLQPQVNAEGRTVSAEALVRWQHPEHGLMPPGLFIPVAEESGLIDPMGRWVLERVCQNLGALRQAGLRMPIAVNISPRQFHQPQFVGDVLSLLEQHRAEPSDLILEITEGVVVQEVDAVVRRMGELTRHGVHFSIDDFGTGYSSLSYLKNLPIHELKIDRSFVQDAPNDPSDAALVEAILSVASHLRLRVVAEGVETPEQAAFFTRHAGVLMQGYLYGRPEPEAEFMQRCFGAASPLGQPRG